MAEDVFLQQCLELLRASSVFDKDLLAEKGCAPAKCTDVTKAAYSPHMEVSDWLSCWEDSDFSIEFPNQTVDTIHAEVRKMKAR